MPPLHYSCPNARPPARAVSRAIANPDVRRERHRDPQETAKGAQCDRAPAALADLSLAENQESVRRPAFVGVRIRAKRARRAALCSSSSRSNPRAEIAAISAASLDALAPRFSGVAKKAQRSRRTSRGFDRRPSPDATISLTASKYSVSTGLSLSSLTRTPVRLT